MAGSAIERILLVDDNDAQTLFWDMLLPEFKLSVQKSRTGADGLDLIERESIQLVIVAWELKSMAGTLFVQKARGSRRRKRMPVLIYSNRMSPEDVAVAKEIGIENILPVPLNKDAARTMLTEMIQREQNISPLENKLRKMEDSLAEGRPAEVLKMVGPDVSKKGAHQPRYKTIIGETFMLLGQFEKAEKALKEALELEPNHLTAKYTLARCYTMQSKHDDAISILDSLSASSPRNIQTLLNLGSAYVAADKISEAKAVVDKVRNLDPESREVKDTQGQIALKEGDLSLAAQMFAATENGEEVARFYNSLGISLVARGQFDKGIETYQSAIKLLANKAKLHLLQFNLGLAYRKKGEKENSLTYLCQSYVSEPAFEKSYNAIARAVAEFKSSGKPLPMDQIGMVKTARKSYLDAHLDVAEKLKKAS